MKKLKYIVTFIFLALPSAYAAPQAGAGMQIGMGLPYIGQGGITYQFNNSIGLQANYNVLDVSSGEASVELTMPEILVTYHPFQGAFFLAAGVGTQSLEVTATETLTNNSIMAEVDSATIIGKLGWMWGSDDGGFWFGVDLSYIMPSGDDVKITAPGVSTSDPNYQDAVDAAEEFGETAYPNITFVRIGYIF